MQNLARKRIDAHARAGCVVLVDEIAGVPVRDEPRRTAKPREPAFHRALPWDCELLLGPLLLPLLLVPVATGPEINARSFGLPALGLDRSTLLRHRLLQTADGRTAKTDEVAARQSSARDRPSQRAMFIQ